MDDIFLGPIIANAIFDRILHHAHVFLITGNLYRLKDHLNFEAQRSSLDFIYLKAS